MTKADVFRPFGGRKHVANFDGIIGDDDPVDEQFNELTFVLEGGVIQAKPDTAAEILEGGSEGGDFALVVNLGLQLALLLSEGLDFHSQVVSTALVLRQWHNGAQVSLGEAVELLFKLGSRLLQSGSAGLQFLR